MINILRIDEEGNILGYENNEITAIPEFKVLWSLDYNKRKGDVDGRKRARAKSELLYMYLMHDPRSIYVNYSEEEKHQEALVASQLPEDWKPSKEYLAVERTYTSVIDTRFYKVLKAAEKALDELRNFLSRVDLTGNNVEGIQAKPKDIIDIISDLPKVSASLRQLQEQAKFSLTSPEHSKADHEIGLLGLRQNNGEGKRKVQQGSTEE